MIAGIVGLGLIGGSFAKAYAEAGHQVLAFDVDANALEFAAISGAVHDKLTKDNIGTCDVVLICVYPEAAISYMEEMGPYIGKKPVVIDCCGIKRGVVKAGEEISKKYGFTYVGGHPMAGTQFSGYKYSRANLYYNAPMVIVPVDHNDILLLARVKELLAPAGFGRYSVTTGEKHDHVIAFTSQLAHLVSNAYVKSPAALTHQGFSAGSYKDMTRVAWLNPDMWTELFMDNDDFLLEELDILIENLKEYREALVDKDAVKMRQLLLDGKLRKEEIDG